MMFEPTEKPRVFGLAPGVDFPAALIAGLQHLQKGRPAVQMAQIDLIVNTRRMARRLRDIFDAGPAGFLPRIRLLSDLNTLVPGIAPPTAISPLQRRLELVQLVSRLLETTPQLAPRASLYALSDSLAALIDEMQGEGVDASAISNLDVTDQSGHWQNTQNFLRIAQDYLTQVDQRPDVEARQRQLVLNICNHWQDHPPQHPVIVAGSTGSRGTTSLLMQAVSRLPQGAVVLPGFDFEMPTAVWADLEAETLAEDHPQFRFHALLRALDLGRGDVAQWHDTPAPSPARNALVSLSLRPAPVTHAWLTEGPALHDLDQATAGLTLLEAPTPRLEALCIAMRLRKAVQDGKSAALITPDRMLTRQVAAALDRWDILPDDSAGSPLHLSPPGRFLRHVAALFHRRLDSEALLVLLKHPLTHSGGARNLHQLFTQQLEAQIRHIGMPYPDHATLQQAADRAARHMQDAESFQRWIEWVASTFVGCDQPNHQALSTWVTQHEDLANRIAAGHVAEHDHELWKKKAGEKARAVMSTLAENAAFGGMMSATDYSDLMGALIAAEEVRDRDAPHPDIMIWGTLEARVQGADLVIMGGLNDGSWPEAPPPDPWLNRKMRKDAGLLLPERRIGLSAHDYQQAIAASEVWLTRSVRSDDAETVPSRWLNRLQNLLGGLTSNGGPQAWSGMKNRGDAWVAQAQALEEVSRSDPAPRPSPRPPIAARPRKLSVTEIQRLIRDPYAIYARHCLGLRAMNPLVQSPDAPLRGTILHQIMETFVKSVAQDATLLSKAHLMEVTRTVLAENAPWPAARAMWFARIERVADWFIDREQRRQGFSAPVAIEDAAMGKLHFNDPDFELTCKADRIDLSEDGDALIYDYKTGTPPSKKVQRNYDKQLLIEAAMVEQGGFSAVGPAHVAHAAYIGLGSTPDEVAAPLDDEPPQEVLRKLHGLLKRYLSQTQGFTARRSVQTEGFGGEFDQLARFGEWDGTTPPTPEDLT